MNSTSKKWSIIDYVNSWSANGNDNYNFVLSVLNRYNLKAPLLFLEIYNDGSKIPMDSISSGGFTAKKEYGDRLLSSYDIILESGLNKSASSLRAWPNIYKKYGDKIQTSTINRIAALVKKNAKVYSQSVNTMEYQTFLEAHINECIVA